MLKRITAGALCLVPGCAMDGHIVIHKPQGHPHPYAHTIRACNGPVYSAPLPPPVVISTPADPALPPPSASSQALEPIPVPVSPPPPGPVGIKTEVGVESGGGGRGEDGPKPTTRWLPVRRLE